MQNVEVSEINVHLTSKTEMHINRHAIVVLSLEPLGACDMRAVFSSQLQQTSISSCERNSHFVTTKLVVELHCMETCFKTCSVLLDFGGFA